MTSRIAIFAPNWLGDAVMALPAIADVRRGSPGAHLTIAARSPVAPLFALVPAVDETIPVEQVRLHEYDVAILLPNSFHAALTARRARIPERWGYRTDWRAPLLTRAPEAPRGLHQVDYYQRLVSALGFETHAAEPRLDVSEDVRAAGRALLQGAGWNSVAPLVALAPGAAYGGAKRWPAEYFGELADALAHDGVVSVLVGSPADAPVARGVEAAARARHALLNLVGRTDLTALAGVLVHARTVVTNDSGAMHVAAAAGVPVTALFGPTRERETAPRGARHVVLTSDVWCRPCMLRECPLEHQCLRSVAPAAVADAARRAL
jgi:heptosyltransferase-2